LYELSGIASTTSSESPAFQTYHLTYQFQSIGFMLGRNNGANYFWKNECL